MFTRAQGISNKRLSGVKTAALAVSLVFSAALTATALRTTGHQWLGWISFLPLFLVVRSLRPLFAAMSGGLWGACLYLFCVAGSAPAIEPSLSSLALLIVVPAVYAALGALPARAIAVNLLVLALGWTLIEAVLLRPLGLQQGLLTGAQGEAAHLHWATRLVGYVLVAFVVGCVNASLLSVLSRARLGIPLQRSFAELPRSGMCPASQTLFYVQFWALRQVYPRGPPISCHY